MSFVAALFGSLYGLSGPFLTLFNTYIHLLGDILPGKNCRLDVKGEGVTPNFLWQKNSVKGTEGGGDTPLMEKIQ